MKKEIINVEASIRARLQNKARETHRPFAEVLQYYAMERFLYRLGQSKYTDKFILKGALMFTVWQAPQRRTTLDIDFLARYDNVIAKLENAAREVCKIKVVPDGLVFDAGTITGQKIKEDADYEGVRIKFKGFLEKSRIPMQMDVAFGDVVYPRPESIDYPVILDFPKPHLKGYPIESVVAEKFEAAMKLGLLNSRMKDFYDLWLMTRQFDFDGARLTEALKRTFAHRKTALPEKPPLFSEEIYDEKSDRQMLWKAFLTKNQNKQAPETLKEVGRIIESFLTEPVDAIHCNIGFDKTWKSTGPWSRPHG